ncbi:hypothetical protein [Escherichia albertii]|uniref:hypothetical protein n=1 Tax=Escherichia albertii TaxID=208962 RepID=UPI000F671CB2|nr:hypothetical protein [Escherichia albertii]
MLVLYVFYYNDIINLNGIFIHINDISIKKYLQGNLKRSEHPLSCSLQAVCQQTLITDSNWPAEDRELPENASASKPDVV